MQRRPSELKPSETPKAWIQNQDWWAGTGGLRTTPETIKNIKTTW